MSRPDRMRIVIRLVMGCLVLAVAFVVFVATALDNPDHARAVEATVLVSVIGNAPNYNTPWVQTLHEVRGSGVVLDDGRILTCAHVVANARCVELRRMGRDEACPARVEFLDNDRDLALLRAERSCFLERVAGLPLGGVPASRATVDVYGYPLDARVVCTTRGTVSGMDYNLYAQSRMAQLVATLRSSLNPGNSGGPAVVNGEIVGLAMQVLEDDRRVAQLVPMPVIRQFLDDIADGQVDGVAELGIRYQPLMGKDIKAYHGLDEDRTGVLVTGVGAGGSGEGVLRAGDAITAIAGQKVSDLGQVTLAGHGAVDMSYPVQSRQLGEQVDMDIVRDGKPLTVSLTLRRGGTLIGGSNFPKYLPYRVYGGIVFQPLDMDLAVARAENDSRIASMLEDRPLATPETRQCVVAGVALGSEYSCGRGATYAPFVTSVQGVAVRDFAHFNRLLDGARGPWITIRLDDDTSVVLDKEHARSVSVATAGLFNIGSDRRLEAFRPPVKARPKASPAVAS